MEGTDAGSEDEVAGAATQRAITPGEALDATARSDGGTVPRAAEVPALIGRFELQRKLGEGGMGAVYLATDPTLRRRVAVKVLRGGDEPAAQRRLLREAQATAQLAHEHVVVVHEVGTHAGQVYLAMEYVAGATLQAWQGGRGWREILVMYRRAGQGLLAAHDAGLVHRDFKPDNVLVGDDGRVRVTDFGLVASVDDASLTLSRDSASLRGELDLAVSMTRTGAVMGTPRYMAPEQHLGEPVDARADQFAFCVALYEAWYRQPPFGGGTYETLRACVLLGEIQPVPATPAVPEPLRDAVLRGLSRRREDRFPSMRELLAALAEPAAEVAAPAPAPAPLRRRPWPWLVGGVVGVVVLALAIAYGLAGRGTRAAAPADPVAAQIAQLGDARADVEVRRAAARALAASSDPRARKALWIALADEQDPEIVRIGRGVHSELMATLDERGATRTTAEQPAPQPRPWADGVSADEQAAALELFKRGNQLLRDRQLTAAADVYRDALTHWKHPAISYNLALALVDLDRPLELRAALTDALAYGEEPLGPEKLATARNMLTLLDARLAAPPAH